MTVLAADAKGMTAAVTELLGLDFRQFTTCVSLPQGDFARFLHAEPRHRQDLLVRLLDLGLYERVAQRARQRERLESDRAALVDRQLEKLSFATPVALAAAERAAARLATLRDEVEAAAPELERLANLAHAADEAAAAATAAVTVLAGVVAPEGIDNLACRAHCRGHGPQGGSGGGGGRGRGSRQGRGRARRAAGTRRARTAPA